MNTPRFIVFGPLNGLYHVCYRIAETNPPQFSSYETAEHPNLAQQRAAQLNAIEEAEQIGSSQHGK